MAIEMSYNKLTESDIRSLKEIVGDDYVSIEEEELIVNAIDAFPGDFHKPEAVVWPDDPYQVARVLAYANDRRIPVTTRAAGTSLSGCCLPLFGGIVLNMARMNRIKEIAERDMTVVVEPGVVYDRLNETLQKYGLFFPPDPGSASVCTIGGMVANNASGLRAVKYGVTKDYVLALQVALPNGKLLRLGSRAFKSSVGPDLTRMMVGSEGTLGIFTEITLRLRPLPRKIVTALALFSQATSATDAVYDIVRRGLDPAAIEFLDKTAIRAVSQFRDLNLPPAEALLVLELHGEDDHAKRMMGEAEKILKKHNAFEVRSADEEEERKKIWEARKGTYPAVLRLSPSPITGDVIVPISKLTNIVQKSYEVAAKYGVQTAVFGHVGDGNIHNLWFADRRDTDLWERANKANEEVITHAVSLGGAVSAEHGIGIEKRKFMRLQHGEAYDLLTKLKRLMDPNNILNPGIMFEAKDIASVKLEEVAGLVGV